MSGLSRGFVDLWTNMEVDKVVLFLETTHLDVKQRKRIADAVLKLDTELEFALSVMPDGPSKWHFFDDDGNTHQTGTVHEFLRFAHTHRSWGYTNAGWLVESADGDQGDDRNLDQQ